MPRETRAQYAALHEFFDEHRIILTQSSFEPISQAQYQLTYSIFFYMEPTEAHPQFYWKFHAS